MGLYDLYLRQRGQGAVIPPAVRRRFMPTQPGDPNFELGDTDTQAQFPAAAAEQRLYSNQVSAQNRLAEINAAGHDVDSKEYAKVREMASRGFLERSLTMGERMIGWIDGPRQFVNLMIQDVLSGHDPEKRGTNIFDYIDAFFGGIEPEQRKQFFEETGLDPVQGSLTLSLLGLEEADTLGGRLLRGVADFGLQIVTDPLSYLTFGLSGLGRKVAREVGQGMVDDVATEVVEAWGRGWTRLDELSPYAREMVGENGKLFESHIDDFLRSLKEQPQEMRAALLTHFQNKLGIDQPLTGLDLNRLVSASEEVVDLTARQVATREVLSPLMDRNFGAIPQVARESLPRFAMGGARLSFPFATRRGLERGIYIPGTAGLGRELVGDRVRKMVSSLRETSKGFDKVAGVFGRSLNAIDTMRPFDQALAKGEIEGWQWAMIRPAFDQTFDDISREQIKRQVNQKIANLGKLVEQEGLEWNDVMSKVLSRVESLQNQANLDFFGNPIGARYATEQLGVAARTADSAVAQDLLTDGKVFSPQAADLAESIAQDIHETRQAYFRLLETYAPEFSRKNLDRYVQTHLTQEGALILGTLSHKAAAVTPAQLRRLQAQGGHGGLLVAQLINNFGGKGRATAQLGGSVEASRRRLGRTNVAMLTDANPGLLLDKDLLRGTRNVLSQTGEFDTGAVAPGVMGIAEMNSLMEPILRQLYEENGLKLPKNWAGKLFEEDPIKQFVGFVDSMDEAARTMRAVQVFRAAGLVMTQPQEYLVQDIMNSIFTRLARDSQTVFDRVKGRIRVVNDELATISEMRRRAVKREQAKIATTGLNPGMTPEDGKKLIALVMGSSPQEFASVRRTALTAPADKFPDLFRRYFQAWDLGTVPKLQGTVRNKWNKLPIPEGLRGNINSIYGTTPGDVSINRAGWFNPEGRLDAVFEWRLNDQGGIESMAWGVREGSNPRQVISSLYDMGDIFATDLAGKIDYKTVVNLLQGDIFSEHGVRMFHRILKQRLHALPDEVLEAWSEGLPAEAVRAQARLNDFVDDMNEFLTTYGQFVDESGELIDISKNPKFKQVRDNEFLTALSKIRDGAKKNHLPTIEKAFRQIRADPEEIAGQPGFVNPSLFALGGPAAEDLIFQKNVAEWLRNVSKNVTTIYTPEGVAALKLATNEALRIWRAHATIARPSFHVRNAIGGIWNNQIIGVRASDYRKVGTNAVRFRNAFRQGLGFDEAIATLDADVQKAFIAAWDEGVMQGFVTTEWRKAASAEKKARWNMMQALNIRDVDNFALTKGGSIIMESIEDFLRLSAFVSWYDEGLTNGAAIAREMAEAVHYNYARLTPWETKMKTFIPFFVWTRRNLPRQLQVFAENPRIIQRYRAMLQSVEDQFSNPWPETGDIPDGDHFTAYAAGTSYMFNANSPFWARVMFDPDLPVKDLLELPRPSLPEMLQFAGDLVGPQITSLTDVLNTREWDDVNAPAPFNTVFKALSAAGLYDTTTASGDVRIPYWMRSLIETAVPFNREITEPMFGGPTDPKRQGRLGIGQDDSGLESAIKSLSLGIARGAGIKLQTPSDVRGVAARSNEELDRILRDLRFQEKAPPSGG